MITDGDRVMVCLSAVKDRYPIIELMMVMKKKAPVYFELIAVNLDQMQTGYP